MTKKLINWSECPSGVKVVHKPTRLVGKFLECQCLMACVFYAGVIEVDYPSTSKIELAPADQQPWLVYEDGVTVVPEWAECEYRYAASSLIDADSSEAYLYEADAAPHGGDGMAVAYKLGNGDGKILKDGWTDNPYEASE
jgi:hypothetical protein